MHIAIVRLVSHERKTLQVFMHSMFWRLIFCVHMHLGFCRIIVVQRTDINDKFYYNMRKYNEKNI